jgi:hypothetical protein
VGFEKTPVLLGLGHGIHLFPGDRPEFNPGRNGLAINSRVALENQLGDKLLHPGGTALRPGAYHDVVITEGKIIQAGGVPNGTSLLCIFYRDDHGLKPLFMIFITRVRERNNHLISLPAKNTVAMNHNNCMIVLAPEMAL